MWKPAPLCSDVQSCPEKVLFFLTDGPVEAVEEVTWYLWVVGVCAVVLVILLIVMALVPYIMWKRRVILVMKLVHYFQNYEDDGNLAVSHCNITTAKTHEPGHEKICLMSYANNKGADQPAHPCSLISAFVVRCLDSIISVDSIAEISRF